jgi:hypothetical protein
MDQKSMKINTEQFRKIALFSLLLALIPLWNIPHTIAGRYICEGFLLILAMTSKLDWKTFLGANKMLLIFFAYLLIHLLFFSTNYQQAFSNFRAEWMHFILFSIIGAGAGLIIGGYKSARVLLFFGIAFSIPLYIHLILFAIKGAFIQSIPWGYTGINEIHGDLGYTALQAIIFLFIYFLYGAKTFWMRVASMLLIIACISSPLLAVSRGGILFTLISIIFISILYFATVPNKNSSLKNKILGLLMVPLLIFGAYQTSQLSNSSKWNDIYSKISMGFQGDPRLIYCQGILSLQNTLQSQGIVITPSIQKILDSVVDGDGARILVARMGASLTVDFPMGINQSKQAYQQALEATCSGAPAIFISHVHNAWIDTALAIGVPGSALLILTLLAYARQGWRALRRVDIPQVTPFGMALFASTSLWILRGLLDSTQRDQMLEMQAFVFSLLLGIITAIMSTQKNGRLVLIK